MKIKIITDLNSLNLTNNSKINYDFHGENNSDAKLWFWVDGGDANISEGSFVCFFGFVLIKTISTSSSSTSSSSILPYPLLS